jgi:hypothetical protein
MTEAAYVEARRRSERAWYEREKKEEKRDRDCRELRLLDLVVRAQLPALSELDHDISRNG